MYMYSYTSVYFDTVGGKDHESAESFFKNIEKQTGTLILWPSKLKIGAKSKKGLFVASLYVHLPPHNMVTCMSTVGVAETTR